MNFVTKKKFLFREFKNKSHFRLKMTLFSTTDNYKISQIFITYIFLRKNSLFCQKIHYSKRAFSANFFNSFFYLNVLPFFYKKFPFFVDFECFVNFFWKISVFSEILNVLPIFFFWKSFRFFQKFWMFCQNLDSRFWSFF